MVEFFNEQGWARGKFHGKFKKMYVMLYDMYIPYMSVFFLRIYQLNLPRVNRSGRFDRDHNRTSLLRS